MRIPTATYRLQFNSFFGFRQAAENLPYLKELGISDIYASPVFEAVPGSSHGYDICNPDRLNPELGASADFELWLEALHVSALGWIQDIVPNHAAYHIANYRLRDVLENDVSFYRNFFDVAWDHPDLSGRVLAPFLGKHYAQCLEAGEVSLHYSEDGLSIRYHDLAWPVKLNTYPMVLQPGPADFESASDKGRQDYLRLSGLMKRFGADGKQTTDSSSLLKQDLWNLYFESQPVREFVAARLCRYHNAHTLDTVQYLDRLLSSQNFKLAYWKNADTEINYRRFFLINSLIGLNANLEAVLPDTHALILQWIRGRNCTGLRIDHIDGLLSPFQYLDRLRGEAGDVYIVLEKILDTHEALPESWPVQGTTGYDFLSRVNSVFCDTRNEEAFTKIYSRLSGRQAPYEALLREKKRFVLEHFLLGDLDNRTRELQRLSKSDRCGRDFTFHDLQKALIALLSSFPVYRTYFSQDHADTPDRNYLKIAFAEARVHDPCLDSELRFLENRLLSEESACPAEAVPMSAGWREFLMGLQQITGTLMAKGLEDTLFYVYNRFVSHNEVGGNPGRFGLSANDFYCWLENRFNHEPHTLNATATHDTKRGEDVRARLNVLSEIPDEWEKEMTAWIKTNRRAKKKVRGNAVPDNNTEYFLYQSLVGAYPFHPEDLSAFQDRFKAYMIKAAREAKEYTSWSDPEQDYEKALTIFIDRILTLTADSSFMSRFLPFQKKISFYGILNSLSQTLLKLTAPGIPDFYQGTELWDLVFVDPDNRGPVDFEMRKGLLDEIKNKSAADLSGFIKEALAKPESGLCKLFLIWRTLQLRKEHEMLFREGAFRPVRLKGSRSNHILAYMRCYGEETVVAVAPRFLTAVISEGNYPLGKEVWEDTAIAVEGSETWCEWISGASATLQGMHLFIGDILKVFPVGLLFSRQQEQTP